MLLLIPRIVDSLWYVQEGARSSEDALGAVHSVVKSVAVVVGLILIPANLRATVENG